MSKVFSIYEAKANLSRLLKLVKDGVDVVVTERGSPIARIIPFKKNAQKLADKILELKEKGLLTEPKVLSESWAESISSIKPKSGVLDEFLKSRE